MKCITPWGHYRVLYRNPRLWVKYIRVLPGESTSLQYHAERTELHLGFWHVLPWVKLIGRYQKHMMYPGHYIEIAWGRPREDDIVRLHDSYNRERPTVEDWRRAFKDTT